MYLATYFVNVKLNLISAHFDSMITSLSRVVT